LKYPVRGEVWIVDLGMTAKIRPCLVLSAPIGETDRALVTLVPHTTSTRGTLFEATIPSQFLRAGAFDAQGLITVPVRFAVRRLGVLSPLQIKSVEAAVCKWLQLPCA